MSESSNKARRYHRAIHQVLMNLWDPIGVRGAPDAQDEYDAYVSGVYGRLIRHVPRHEPSDYLRAVETGCMELRGDRERVKQVAEALLRLQEESEGAGSE